MILSAQTIEQQIGMITPLNKKMVINGMTFGLSEAGYDIRIAENVTLFPNDFVSSVINLFGHTRPSFILASSVEYFKIPDNIMFSVTDKSTWARQGLAVQNTRGEPGWMGYLTLELTNHGPNILRIAAGSPIAQLIFEFLDKPTVIPYNGKYQHQKAGPQPSIYE